MRSFLLLTFFALLAFHPLHAQQSHNMTLLDRYDVDTLPESIGYAYNDCWGYTDCDAREYAILGSASYMHFLDLADPTNIKEIAAIPGGNTTLWREMRTFGQRAYSVCDNCSEGMMIFDLSQLPDTVVKTNQISSFFQSCHTIFIDVEAGWLYAAGTNTTNDGLFIFDLNADPDNPVLIGNTSLPGGYVHDMYVRGKIGYCSHGNNGYYVYDFSNPQTPILLGTLTDYPQSGYNHSSWMTDDGQYMVLCDETHNRSVKMLDVSDLSDIQVTDLFRSALLGPQDTASIAHNPVIREHYAFVSYYHDGVQVFDISDPYDVKKVAWYDTHLGNNNYNGFEGCWGVYAFLPSGLILGSDMNNGLYVLQLDSIFLDPLPVPLYPGAEIQLTGEANFCEGQSVGLVADSNAGSIEWYMDGELMEQESPQIEVSASGVYTATLHDEYCTTQSDPVMIQVFVPIVPSLSFANDTLFSSPALSYQWFLDGEPINGATGPFITPLLSGLYSVETVDTNGCGAVSEEFLVTINSAAEGLPEGWKIYPNPAQDQIIIEISGNGSFTLTDLLGRVLVESVFISSVSQVDLEYLSKGMYVLRLQSEGKAWIEKIEIR